MPRMGEGESFAGRGQGGTQAAARSAGSVVMCAETSLMAPHDRWAAWPAARSRRHPESIIEDAKKCVFVRKSEISEDNLDVNEKNRGLMWFSIVA